MDAESEKTSDSIAHGGEAIMSGNEGDGKTKDSQLRFPSQFSRVPDIFGFSYHSMSEAVSGFNPEDDIERLLNELQAFFQKMTNVTTDDIEILELVTEELEIIQFSKSSRCNIISL